MVEDVSKVQPQIAKNQLAWILDDCFTEKEIITLAEQCGIHDKSGQPHSISRGWLVKKLADNFFDKALTEEVVSQYLGQKVQPATRRIGYMDLEEIQFFWKSPAQLLEDEEFGEIIWALLINPHEAVQQHGCNLLAQHDSSLQPDPSSGEEIKETDLRTLPLESDDVQQGDRLDADIEAVNLPSHGNVDEEAPVESVDAAPSVSPDLKSHWSETLEQNEKIDQLHRTIHELRYEYTTVQRENDQLKGQLQQLTEENRRLKEDANRYGVVESRCGQLEDENKSLRQDVGRLSDQLSELHRLKSTKAELAVEFRSAEEAVYQSLQITDQIQSDFQTQLVSLQKANETSKAALASTRQRITNLIDPQASGGGVGSRMIVGQPRVGVFVDVQNMFYAAKDRYAGRVDYIKLLDLIVGPRQLVVAYAYVVQIPEINQSGFLSLLEHNGYTIKSKDLRLRGDGSAKGDWDVGIAIDIVSMLNALDVVILASGDGDFCALAEVIKQHDKRVEVVAFEHNTSMDLLRIADQFFPIGDDLLI